MKETSDILFSLIRYELTGEDPIIPSPDTLAPLYDLSNKHDIAHIIGNALKKSSVIIPEELARKFDKKEFTAFYRYEQSNYELERIKESFDSNKIPFIPLKGAIIRKLYPAPWMRTSCDIDILIEEQNLEAATTALESELGYTAVGRGSHDVQLISSGNKVNIELHYTLIEENFVSKDVERILNSAWEYASTQNSGYLYEFSDEFFLFYHVAHMAKHFSVGGCGIKPLLDLYILGLSNKLKPELVEKSGLMPFYTAASELGNVWFSNGDHSELTEKMEKYILNGGLFGNMQNKVAAGKTKNGSSFAYVFSRLFPPYGVMKNQHPSLRKYPFLLPFFYVKRWVKPLFDGRFKKTAKELTLSAKTDSNNEYSDMIKKLGI